MGESSDGERYCTTERETDEQVVTYQGIYARALFASLFDYTSLKNNQLCKVSLSTRVWQRGMCVEREVLVCRPLSLVNFYWNQLWEELWLKYHWTQQMVSILVSFFPFLYFSSRLSGWWGLMWKDNMSMRHRQRRREAFTFATVMVLKDGIYMLSHQCNPHQVSGFSLNHTPTHILQHNYSIVTRVHLTLIPGLPVLKCKRFKFKPRPPWR